MPNLFFRVPLFTKSTLLQYGQTVGVADEAISAGMDTAGATSTLALGGLLFRLTFVFMSLTCRYKCLRARLSLRREQKSKKRLLLTKVNNRFLHICIIFLTYHPGLVQKSFAVNQPQRERDGCSLDSFFKDNRRIKACGLFSRLYLRPKGYCPENLIIELLKY